jgi:hypothetical protein
MKTYNFLKTIATSIVIVATSFILSNEVSAQQPSYKPYFGNVDWQFNAPFSNEFTNRASGWGASFEGGYFVTPKIGLGLFVSYSSNHKSIPTQTLHPSANTALTAKQERTLFQLPFGVNLRYRLFDKSNICDPYFGLKLGATYAQLSSYMSSFKVYDNSWGFYMSPEIGTNLWMSSEKTFGFNIALYYSLSTNTSRVLDGHVNQLNNMGFRVGVAF